ncbi:hypothetical protein C289_2786 [Anoxybacillus ayderensis]|nr:hypothetical protein C289_2786 [Anoxybacillus ayderensis]
MEVFLKIVVPVTPRRLSKFYRDRESLNGSLFLFFRIKHDLKHILYF